MVIREYLEVNLWLLWAVGGREGCWKLAGSPSGVRPSRRQLATPLSFDRHCVEVGRRGFGQSELDLRGQETYAFLWLQGLRWQMYDWDETHRKLCMHCATAPLLQAFNSRVSFQLWVSDLSWRQLLLDHRPRFLCSEPGWNYKQPIFWHRKEKAVSARCTSRAGLGLGVQVFGDFIHAQPPQSQVKPWRHVDAHRHNVTPSDHVSHQHNSSDLPPKNKCSQSTPTDQSDSK